MAWSYRKRIKIAPGISLNVSKKGASTSFGVRGASITTGRNGTYLNTGIPGTGIYSRKKISGGHSTNVPSSNFTNTQTSTSGTGQGCLIALGIAVVIGLFAYNTVAGLIGLAMFAFIMIIAKTSSSGEKKVEQSVQSKIELAKTATTQATNPIQKEILQSYVSCVELSKKADEKEAIINALQAKLAKKEKAEFREQLTQYETELSDLHNELERVQFDADKNLSDIEKHQFSKLCDNFENLLECQKIWIITSSVKSTELKSSASTSVNRKPITFDIGVFNYIKSAFDIPVLRDDAGITYYIYPQFVIKAVSFCDFQIFPKETVSIDYSNQRFIESEIPPSESGIVDYTYQYVNKNGGPDKRFSYNPRYPVLIYGKLDISPLNLSFHFSNAKSAKQFADAFNGNQDISINKSYAETLTFPTTNEITEPYFNSINGVVEKLVTLFEKLKNDKGFQAVFAEGVKMRLNVNGEDLTDFTEHFRTVLLMDMTKCYVELDHPIDLDSKEGIGLLLLLARTNGLEKISFATLGIVANNSLVKSSEEYISYIHNSIINKSLPDVEEKFVISRVLHEYNLDLQKQYLVLLYRFISITAKADGTVTETEQKWLSELMKLGNTNDKMPLLNEENESNDYSDIDLSHRDPLFEKAARLLVVNQNASTSSIQRTFAVGYNRAGRIINQLEAAGIIGAFDGINTRQILIKNDLELEALLKKINDEPSIKTIKRQNEKSEQTYPMLKSNYQIELKSLIGLSSVKKEIETLTNFIKIQKEREAKGLKVSQPSYHCVFTGNPGTGKTTVARIVAGIYKELGVLKNGHLVETDRSGLVAEYVGQTAVKTNKIVDSALDGVLFIDEAYSLIAGSENDYGKEAIATLLKRMEDNRDRLVVILAGYTVEMQDFINSNSGLQSRFNRYIEFPDYSAEELYEIFELNTKKFDYSISDAVIEKLKVFFNNSVKNKDSNFGNARFVRNFFEKALESQANRLAKETNLTTEKLTEISVEDINVTV